MKEESIHKHDWIFSIVPNLAFAAGVIMASIAGVMILSSILKLSLFQYEPYEQITREQCLFEFPYKKPLPITDGGVAFVDSDKNAKPSEKDIQMCLKERRTEAKERFQLKKKENIVDGISILIVGLILIISFRKRKKS